MKVRLIKGWKTWHKWWSTRLKIIGLLLIAAPEAIIHAWSMIPHDIKATIPAEWVSTVGIFLVAASSFAQVVKQRNLEHKSRYGSLDNNVEKRGRRQE